MSRLIEVFSRRPVMGVFIALLISASVIALKSNAFLQAFELWVFDRYLPYRVQASSSPPIVLVTITETDIQRFGHPLDDATMAQALSKILHYKPAVIGVDIYRDLPSRGRPEFIQLLAEHSNIFLIEKRLGEQVLLPDDLLPVVVSGFSDLVPDHDGVIRRALLMYWDDQQQAHLSLAMSLALSWLNQAAIVQSADPDTAGGFRLGNTAISRFEQQHGGYARVDDGGYQLLMDYAYGNQSFEHITLSALFDEQAELSRLSNNIVILGSTSSSVQDSHETPFSAVDNTPRYGIEIHAHIVDQLVRSGQNLARAFRFISEWQEHLLIATLCLCGAFMGVYYRSIPQMTMTLMCWLAALFGLPFALFIYGLWLPVIALSLAWLSSFFTGSIYCGYMENREKKMVMMLFGKYVTEKVAMDLWQKRDLFLHGGRPKPVKLTATILITDFKNFTTAVESMPPEQVLIWLNRYMSAMTEIIEAHGGMVEDYAGDGIKACFGVPLPRSEDEIIEDADNAAQCALAMGKKFVELNQSFTADEIKLNKLRLGICSGQVTAGSIGSDHRMSYTTIGDTVNVAARLENFDKEGFDQEQDAYRVLIDDSTKQMLSHRFNCQLMGEYYLKGRTKISKIYRIFNAQE